MSHSNPAITLSVRIPSGMRNQLDRLSDATGRTRSFLAVQAIESYLATQAWQVDGIKQAVKKANDKNTQFFEHNDVLNWVDSWNSGDEQEISK